MLNEIKKYALDGFINEKESSVISPQGLEINIRAEINFLNTDKEKKLFSEKLLFMPKTFQNIKINENVKILGKNENKKDESEFASKNMLEKYYKLN